jgi:predicted DNA-binding protein
MKDSLTEFVKIRVSEELKLRIENIAAAQGISMSDYCRLCILKEMQNVNEIELAAARLESLNKLKDSAAAVTKKVVTGVKIEPVKE